MALSDHVAVRAPEGSRPRIRDGAVAHVAIENCGRIRHAVHEHARCRVACDEPTETISVTVPARNLIGKYSDIRDYCGTAVQGDTGFGYLLRNFLVGLWERKGDFANEPPTGVADILNELIYPCFRRNADS